MLYRVYFCIIVTTFFYCANGQTGIPKLQKAFEQFEADSQLRHAACALYVINAKTGTVVFEKNAQMGLAPASTQKIVTAVTAFEFLGKDFRYKTELAHDGTIRNGELTGNLLIVGTGDPTLGSWRYRSTIDTVIINKWSGTIQKLRIKKIDGTIVGLDNNFETQTVPGGWIWEDIGNYYGAGVSGLNWHENQYDLELKPGKNQGDPVTVGDTYPEIENKNLVNELTTGAKASGDNAYIYYPPNGTVGFLRGTAPADDQAFSIAGSLSIPPHYPAGLLGKKLQKSGITILGHWPKSGIDYLLNKQKMPSAGNVLLTLYSPSLDSIVYWFLKKSINLYGEALLKTISYITKGFGTTDSAIAIIKNFWQQKGLDAEELNIRDGSGLSPLNRITAHAQVAILKYAKTRSWFPYFFDALPEYNNMKMKSGSISDVKGFCGYQTSRDGTEYIFSFLVNNYNGSAQGVVNKMYLVLDSLK